MKKSYAITKGNGKQEEKMNDIAGMLLMAFILCVNAFRDNRQSVRLINYLIWEYKLDNENVNVEKLKKEIENAIEDGSIKNKFDKLSKTVWILGTIGLWFCILI